MDIKKGNKPYVGRSTRLEYWIISIVLLVPGGFVMEISSGWIALLMLILFVNFATPICLSFLKGENKGNKYGLNPYVKKFSDLAK